MSCSGLWGINKDYAGEELREYKNSWLFSPIIWEVLSDKVLPRDLLGNIQSVTGLHGNKIWEKINYKMNNSSETADRICWEISNQNIFFTKDKEVIARNIRMFVDENKKYCKSVDGNISVLEREHIVERFNEIADDILNLDENEYPYFVFKNTSVDDGVENYFSVFDKEMQGYVTKPLSEQKEFVAEFVKIENGNIVNFIRNWEFKYE